MPPGSDRGLAGGPPRDASARARGCWDAFIECARAADLDRTSRVPGRTGRQICIPLGGWPDRRPLARVLAAARSGETSHRFRPDVEATKLIRDHADATSEEVLEALAVARDSVVGFLDSPEAATLGGMPTVSPVGPLPVLTIVSGMNFELAVAALDLAPCGAPPPPEHLLLSAVAGLVDVTGGLAARKKLSARVSVQSPRGGWAFTSANGGWVTTQLPPGPVPGCAVLGELPVLVDVAASRAWAAPALATGRVRVQEMGTLLTLVSKIESSPGVPTIGALQAAARALSGAAGLVFRLWRR
jgi:hypothetical protein